MAKLLLFIESWHGVAHGSSAASDEYEAGVDDKREIGIIIISIHSVPLSLRFYGKVYSQAGSLFRLRIK